MPEGNAAGVNSAKNSGRRGLVQAAGFWRLPEGPLPRRLGPPHNRYSNNGSQYNSDGG